MDTLELSKFDVAERQLHLAIELFFKQSDPVSICTLSEAASQVLRDIAPKFSKHSFYRQHPDLSKKGEKDLNNELNKARNFFKHADKDPDSKINFKPTSNHLSIFEVSLLHMEIKGSVDPEVLIYLSWFLSSYSHVFPLEPDFKDKIEQAGLL
ncbi:hypothetical protein BCT35_06515 [Vibrio lentus]|uniref:hypothetical protein n=1 Tax=Vibrio lentus TaxID=136468 RepID=UPI000C843664|nr:hypothetical protein [Vibrio lentus]PML48210.1 hypothetical protein BCT75_20680 [Vibrio lentus]PMN25127.1 hypothetical protein BCT35_06515 [Vibrio lentus]